MLSNRTDPGILLSYGFYFSCLGGKLHFNAEIPRRGESIDRTH